MERNWIVEVIASDGESTGVFGPLTEQEADGWVCLKATVTAVPEGGKANEALLKLLAKTWKLPKTSLEIASGVASRRKLVRIAGDPGALYEMLTDWGRKFQ